MRTLMTVLAVGFGLLAGSAVVNTAAAEETISQLAPLAQYSTSCDHAVTDATVKGAAAAGALISVALSEAGAGAAIGAWYGFVFGSVIDDLRCGGGKRKFVQVNPGDGYNTSLAARLNNNPELRAAMGNWQTAEQYAAVR